MSIDEKPEDQITEAGAVELEERALDNVSGGLLPAVKTVATTDPSASAPSGATYHIENAWPTKWRVG